MVVSSKPAQGTNKDVGEDKRNHKSRYNRHIGMHTPTHSDEQAYRHGHTTFRKHTRIHAPLPHFSGGVGGI